MNVAGVSGAADLSAGNSADSNSKKIGQAAHDFEALLVTLMLRGSHGDGGWLGTNDDDANDAALGMGEEQLAQAMANSGGMGLAKMVEASLEKAPPSQTHNAS